MNGVMRIMNKAIGLATICCLMSVFAHSNTDDTDRCTRGDIRACYMAGLRYQRHNQTLEANKYFKIACDHNRSSGCFSLGVYYHIRWKKYHSLAVKYYTKACELNSAKACNNLGNMYRDGKGVDKNISKAIRLYEKSYCLSGLDKPYINREKAISVNGLNGYSNTVDCKALNYNEAMNTDIDID